MSRVPSLVMLLLVSACTPEGLSTEQLSSVVKEQEASLDACYNQALQRQPDKRTLQGEAIIEVAPSGKVTSVEIAGELPLEGLSTCVHDAISGWTFPKANGSTRTALPLIFEPRVETSTPLELP